MELKLTISFNFTIPESDEEVTENSANETAEAMTEDENYLHFTDSSCDINGTYRRISQKISY